MWPTWRQLGAQDGAKIKKKSMQKSVQKSILEGIIFLIDFCNDFLSILAPSWDPSWGHVGHIFAQNGGGLWHAPVFFVGSMLFFDFGALLAPSWLHFGGVGARFFQFVGRFGGRLWKVLGSSLEVSGDHLGPMCSVFLAKYFVY